MKANGQSVKIFNYLDRWEEPWADIRIDGATKRQVSATFAEEKPALLPLLVEPFRLSYPKSHVRQVKRYLVDATNGSDTAARFAGGQKRSALTGAGVFMSLVWS
jgi:hypothetical protein